MLVLRAAGLSRKQIAHDLNISDNTVKGHISRAYDKLGANGLLEALRSIGLVS